MFNKKKVRLHTNIYAQRNFCACKFLPYCDQMWLVDFPVSCCHHLFQHLLLVSEKTMSNFWSQKPANNNYVTRYKESRIQKHFNIPYTWTSDKCRPLRLPLTMYNFSSTTAAACYNEKTQDGVSMSPKVKEGFQRRSQEWQMTFSTQKQNNS